MARKKRKPRVYPLLPAPRYSQKLFARILPEHVGMFRYLLEAEDNLGYMSVVNKYDAILSISFSPHQEREIRVFLQGMQETIPFTLFELPDVDELGKENLSGT